MKITVLKESANFATLDTEKLFNKLKPHELSYKGQRNHDASFTSKALLSSARVGGHDANPTNTISPSLEFALSSLAITFDEQYESIPDDEIALCKEILGNAQVLEGEEKKLMGLLRVWQHHPLHRRLPQAEKV
jgi:hypothetical protein